MAREEKRSNTYASTGVNYDILDHFKRLAQLRARTTARNLERFGMREMKSSRGESAYVWEESGGYRAFVIEGLGTKNRVADEVRKFTGKTHYDAIAQDTVAMIVNDLITVGAEPQVINAYFAVGSSDWFSDEERARDLIEGWAKATNLSGAVWGGGETPTLKGIIEADTIDLSGSAVGIVKPKNRLALGNKLNSGDAIFLVESSGIHANGLTLTRTVASSLPKGYATLMSDGKSYGESLLTPTHIYSGLIKNLYEAGIDIHYMVNITGHGWRKLMRANRDFTYIINSIPEPQPIFKLIQEQSGNNDEEMFGNFNMGAGFAIFMPEKDTSLAEAITNKYGFSSSKAGQVVNGPRRVVIEPKKIEFLGNTLGVR